MAELKKYDNVGIVEAPFLTAASSGFLKITTSYIDYLAAVSANETAGIAVATSAIRPILGKITHVGDDDEISVGIKGVFEVPCGETITIASVLAGSLPGLFGTASGVLYAVTASYATAKGGDYGNVKLLKGGSTSTKAIIQVS